MLRYFSKLSVRILITYLLVTLLNKTSHFKNVCVVSEMVGKLIYSMSMLLSSTIVINDLLYY